MTVWYAIPSKRPPAEAEAVLRIWREQGYRLALFRDAGDPQLEADLLLVGDYPGYGAAVNALAGEILARDPEAEWIVTGGDDVEPDRAHSAEEIALSCARHFGEEQGTFREEPIVAGHHDLKSGIHSIESRTARMPYSTFGVMQPTGDRWGESHPPHDGTAYIDRVCGSPWLGRDWCARAYQGNGPLNASYHHMGVDEELQAVAVKLGVFWQRRDLIHFHRHWGRTEGGYGNRRAMPEFLREANSPQHWQNFKRLFDSRKALGFPGHEPLGI